MAWIDDRLWCHPKIAGVPKAARWTYAASIAYSSGFSTAGVLDVGQQQMIGTEAKERMALITVGLWDELGNGSVRIHDWDEHNGKRDARKAADRARKRTAYLASKKAESPQENARRNGGEAAENREESRALKVVKEVTGDGSTAVGSLRRFKGSTADSTLEHEIDKLLRCLGKVDEGTRGVLVSFARKLPPSSVAKVRESCQSRKVGAGYAVNALKSELAELEEVTA